MLSFCSITLAWSHLINHIFEELGPVSNFQGMWSLESLIGLLLVFPLLLPFQFYSWDIIMICIKDTCLLVDGRICWFWYLNRLQLWLVLYHIFATFTMMWSTTVLNTSPLFWSGHNKGNSTLSHIGWNLFSKEMSLYP